MGSESGRRPWTIRTIGTFALASCLALLATVAPPAAPSTAAADDFLRLSADATYRVDTDDRLVRVRIDFRATNLRPNTARRDALGVTTTRYYFDHIFFAVPPEARSVVATSGGSRLTTSVRARDGYREITVRFANLYYRASRAIRVEFSLPGGKPRSTSDIRVGSAFTTFTAWAWGDDGRSTVRILLPKGFDDAGYGERITQRTQPDHVELSTGTLQKPFDWYRVIVADRPTALTDLRIEPGGRPVVVKAWPEDTVWRDRVAEVLKDGLPALQELVGLPWPVRGDLSISEVHAPLLHGYAGFYDAATDEITMSEDLDDHTILHEASHAWFNGDLIRDRWIDEGLAEYYADRVRQELGMSNEFAPTVVQPTDEGAFPLNDWPDPARIDDEKTDQQERFGYGAAYTVILRIAEDIGDEGMQAVLAAAEAGHNPYAGDEGPERTGARPDWRRFLDLVEELGDTDTADDLFRRWVMPSSQVSLLRERGTARDAYAELDAAADEWAVPRGIRAYMSLWRFEDATTLMETAGSVVERRDDLATAATGLRLSTPTDLEAPFEAAVAADDLAEVTATIEDRIDAAAALADARDALALERTPLTTLGLAGEVPDAGYVAARSAFEAGDVAAVVAGSAATMSLLAGAESVGTTRAAVITAIVLGLLLLLAVLVLLVRRRRRQRRQLALSAAASASTTLPATPEPAGIGPELASTPIETAPGAEPD